MLRSAREAEDIVEGKKRLASSLDASSLDGSSMLSVRFSVPFFWVCLILHTNVMRPKLSCFRFPQLG